MTRRKILSVRNLLPATARGLSTAALAEMTVFSAQCLSNSVDADSTGTDQINGAPRDVAQINPGYSEALTERLTVSISHEGGERDPIVNFTGSGGANGPCRILSAVPLEAAGADGGGGAMASASKTERVTLAALLPSPAAAQSRDFRWPSDPARRRSGSATSRPQPRGRTTVSASMAPMPSTVASTSRPGSKISLFPTTGTGSGSSRSLRKAAVG